MKQQLTIGILAIATCFVVLAPSTIAFAEDATLSSGDVVRRKILYRSTRFEFTPIVGVTLADAYRRNILAGINLSYHLTNEFGITASGYYGVLHPATDLANSVESQLSGAVLNELSMSYIQFVGDLGLTWAPIFGKFSMFGTSASYDFHVAAGALVVGESVEAAVEGGREWEDIGGVRPGGFLQFGVRIFLSDMISLNTEIKNMFYSRAEASSGAAEPAFRDTVMLGIGLGIFLPGEVKISR